MLVVLIYMKINNKLIELSKKIFNKNSKCKGGNFTLVDFFTPNEIKK